MGRAVGRISIVETPPILPNEPTLFARRKGRMRPSRVVLTADSLVSEGKEGHLEVERE